MHGRDELATGQMALVTGLTVRPVDGESEASVRPQSEAGTGLTVRPHIDLKTGNTSSPPAPTSGGAKRTEPARGSRANGTNPRSRAERARREQAERELAALVARLREPDDQERAAWDAMREQLQGAVPDSTWSIWLEPLSLAGLDGPALVLEAPDEIRSWVAGRFGRLLQAYAEQTFGEGTPLQLVQPRKKREAVVS
jgi:hypothetical protein